MSKVPIKQLSDIATQLIDIDKMEVPPRVKRMRRRPHMGVVRDYLTQMVKVGVDDPTKCPRCGTNDRDDRNGEGRCTPCVYQLLELVPRWFRMKLIDEEDCDRFMAELMKPLIERGEIGQ